MKIVRSSGFVLLNILLGTILLVGIVLLIMQTMGHFHAEEKYQALGKEFAPILSTLLTQTYTSSSYAGICGNLLSSISPDYLQSLSDSGFDLCSTATVSVSCVNAQGGSC